MKKSGYQYRHQQCITKLLKDVKFSHDKLLINFAIKRIKGISSNPDKYLIQGEFIHLSIDLARKSLLLYKIAVCLIQKLLETKANLNLRQIINNIVLHY